jgi:hypothetical protein
MGVNFCRMLFCKVPLNTALLHQTYMLMAPFCFYLFFKHKKRACSHQNFVVKAVIPSMNLKVMLDNQLKPLWMWNLSSGSFVFPSDCQGRESVTPKT